MYSTCIQKMFACIPPRLMYLDCYLLTRVHMYQHFYLLSVPIIMCVKCVHYCFLINRVYFFHIKCSCSVYKHHFYLIPNSTKLKKNINNKTIDLIISKHLFQWLMSTKSRNAWRSCNSIRKDDEKLNCKSQITKKETNTPSHSL